MRGRLLRGIGVLALSAMLGLIAWHQRDLDPDAWRSFARQASGRELETLASDDGSRENVVRWGNYLSALRSGDDEALLVAARLCPLLDGHVGEQFLGALGWNLERRPVEVLELMKPCARPAIVCIPFDDETELAPLNASIERRRKAVMELLDGGLNDVATECLRELRD